MPVLNAPPPLPNDKRQSDTPGSFYGGKGYAPGTLVAAPYHFNLPAPPVDPNAAPPKRDALGAGWEAAKTNLFSGVPYAVKKAFDTLSPQEQQGYLDAFKASAAKQEKLLPGGPIGLGQIHGVKDFGQFVAEQLGYSLPQMAATGAGALAGSLIGPEGTVAGIAGTMAGGAAASAPFYVGSNIEAATNQGEQEATPSQARRSIGVAVPQAIGDVAEEAVGLPFLGGKLGKLAAPFMEREGAGLAEKVISHGVKTAAVEGGVEYGQQAGELYASGKDLLAPDSQEQMKQAGLAGAVLGGTIGAVTGPFAGHKPHETAEEDQHPVPVTDPRTGLPAPDDLLALPGPGPDTGGPGGTPTPGPHDDAIDAEFEDIMSTPVEGQRALPAPDRQPQIAGTRPSQVYGPAIAAIESRGSGDYDALGPVTKHGDRGIGRYMVMGRNVGDWTEDAGLGRMTPEEFSKDHAAQDAVFDHRFGGYVAKYGSPAEAASVWFTGKPLAKGGNATDVLGTTGNEYVRKFNAAMQGVPGTSAGTSTGGRDIHDVITHIATSPKSLEAQIKELSGEDTVMTAAPLAQAISQGGDAAANALTAERGRIDAAHDALAKASDTMEPGKVAAQEAHLARRENVLTAANHVAKKLADARGPQITTSPAAIHADTLPGGPQPNPDLAAMGEHYAAQGAQAHADNMSARSQMEMTQAQAAARTEALKGVMSDKNSTDPHGDFRDALTNDLKLHPATPLMEHEQLALDSKAGFLRRQAVRDRAAAIEAEAQRTAEANRKFAEERGVAPEDISAQVPGAEEKAAKQAARTAREQGRVAPTEAEKPVAPVEPTVVQPEPAPEVVHDHADAYAKDHNLGSTQEHWFQEGVKGGLGETHETPAPAEERKARNFEKGQQLVARLTGKTPKTATTPAAPKAAPKTEAAKKAVAAKPAPKTEAAKPKPAPKTEAAKKAVAAKPASKTEAAKPKAPAAARKEPPAAAKKAAATSVAKKTPAPPAAATPVLAPADIPPAPHEDRARSQFRGDAEAAMGNDYGAPQTISAFQKQALDILHDRDLPPPLLQLALRQAQDDYKAADNIEGVGKAETGEKAADALLTKTLQRVKRIEALAEKEDAKPQTTENVVTPAKPAPGVAKNEAPPITETTKAQLESKLLPHEKPTLAKAYGHAKYGANTLAKFTEDFVNFVNGVTKGIDKAVLAIAKRMQAAVLAVSIVFNPIALHPINLAASAPRVVTQTTEVTTKVPANAKAKMSAMAARVYETQAKGAMETGKGFIIADKPNGMLHIFDKDGAYVASDTALYGAQAGDVLPQSRYSDPFKAIAAYKPEDKVTPAGKFRIERAAAPAETYTGGAVFWLVNDAHDGFHTVALHAVIKENPAEKRVQRLASATPADNKISWGCINTSDQTFLGKLLAHEADFNGGTVFVLPDVVANTEATFPATTKTEQVPGKPGPAPIGPAEGLPTGEQARTMEASRRQGRGAPKPEPTPDEGESFARRGEFEDMSRGGENMSASEFEDYWDRRFSAEAELRQQLDQMGLHDIGAKISSWFEMAQKYGTDTPVGIYNKLYKLVELAMEGKDKRKTGFHEGGHGLRDLDLFAKDEWAKLAAYAKKLGTTAEAAKELPNKSAGLHEEEGIVEAYARWASGLETHPPEGVAALFERLGRMLRAIASSFTGHDFRSAEDIFRQMYTGEIGRRERGVERMGARQFSGDVFHRSQAQARAAHNSPQSKMRRGVKDRAAADLNIFTKVWGLRGHLYITPTEDIANMMSTKGVKSARRVIEAHSAAHAEGRKYEERINKIKTAYQKLAAKLKGTGPGSISKLMYDMTRAGKWAFSPDHLPPAEKAKAVIDPALQAQFKAMPPDAQAVLRQVFEHNYKANKVLEAGVRAQIRADYLAEWKEATTQAQKDNIKKRMARAISATSRAFDVQAGLPYTPLKRSGWWAVVGKSKALQAAEKAGDKALIDKLTADDAHHFVDFRDNERQAQKLAEHIETKFGSEGTYFFERSKVESGAIHKDAVFLALDQLRKAVAGNTEKGSQVSERMQRLVNDLYLHSLAETSARKSELGRANVPAEDPVTKETFNMMHAFVTHGQATANLIGAMHTGPELNSAIFAMQKEAQTLPVSQRRVAQTMVNEMMYRYTANANVKPSRLADRMVKGVSFWTLLSSPFYYLQNFTQAGLISVPVLASKYGYPTAVAHLMRGYKDFAEITKGSGGAMERIDFSKHSDPKIRDLLEFLANRGRLDAGLSAENGHWETTLDGALPEAGRLMDKFFRRIPQFIEVSNRVATGIAGYRAAIEAGKSEDVARGEASKLIYDTHGDYSGFNAPTPFHQLGAPGKVLLQFRKFQVIMGSLIAKEFHRTFFKPGVSREERLQGAAALGFLAAHMAAIGGALAMPGANILGPIIGALMNLVDPKSATDWDDWRDILRVMLHGGENWQEGLRKGLGAGGEGKQRNPMADFLFKGAPYSLLNADTSDRLGMGNIFAFAPYVDIDQSSSKEHIFSELFKAAMGPSGNLISKAIDGWGYGIDQGDWMRFLETVAPTGPANVMKAIRLSDEGLTAANGDVLMKPEKMQGMPAFLTALGVRPRVLVNEGDRRSQQYKINEFFTAETTRINREYTAAAKDHDPAAMVRARLEFQRLQARRKTEGLRPQPLTNLLKAPAAQKKREHGIIGGVETTPANRAMIMNMMFADTPEEMAAIMAGED